jgi:guanylate kinase
MGLARRGIMLVLSSPSGAGKTTVCRKLLAEEANISLSISVTTRPPRIDEKDGIDYWFVNDNEFNMMVNRNEFIEHALVFGHSYGTPKKMIEETLEAGQDILFDIDWQGTQQLGLHARDDLASVFLLPPTMEELKARLSKRAQDSSQVVEGRMMEASSELSHWAEYDYVLVNDDLEETISKVREILNAERNKTHRLPNVGNFVRNMGKK